MTTSFTNNSSPTSSSASGSSPTSSTASGSSANGFLHGAATHASRLCGSGSAETPKAEPSRTAGVLPNLRANAEMVAPDLPDPAAVGYLLLLFDQCRTCKLTHAELVAVFGRPLLSFLDLALQAVEKLAARSGIGRAEDGEVDEPGAAHAAPMRRSRFLTPYQLARLRDIAGEYVAAMPEARALEALLLIYDLLEIFELSAGQCETVFGAEALQHITALVYGEERKAGAGKPVAEKPGAEATHYDLPSQAPAPIPVLRIGEEAIPIVGTVGDGGRVTFAPEARLWLRYIGAPDNAASTKGADDRNGGAA